MKITNVIKEKKRSKRVHVVVKHREHIVFAFLLESVIYMYTKCRYICLVGEMD